MCFSQGGHSLSLKNIKMKVQGSKQSHCLLLREWSFFITTCRYNATDSQGVKLILLGRTPELLVFIFI